MDYPNQNDMCSDSPIPTTVIAEDDKQEIASLMCTLQMMLFMASMHTKIREILMSLFLQLLVYITISPGMAVITIPMAY
jgi:hypothetical protein